MRTELLGVTVVTVLLIARLLVPIALTLVIGTLLQRQQATRAR